MEERISSSPYVLDSSPNNCDKIPSGSSCVRSTYVPFKSSIITEFFFTIVSVSEADMMPNSVTMLIINNTILDKMIPVTVASVNFKKSFIILIVFSPACY